MGLTDLPLIGCALTDEQLAERERAFARLREDVRAVRSDGTRVEADLAPDADPALALAILAAERECCSFLETSWDADAHRLAFAIPEQRFRPTLDAIASALAPR